LNSTLGNLKNPNWQFGNGKASTLANWHPNWQFGVETPQLGTVGDLQNQTWQFGAEKGHTWHEIGNLEKEHPLIGIRNGLHRWVI
jgi:hypothetical protein